MFNNEGDFKKIVDRLNIDSKPSPSHREKLRRQMLSEFDRSSKRSIPRIIIFQTIRRTIMKSKITKFAAAAVIIIAVFTGVHYLGGSIDGATVAWAQVVEQISNHTKYKCRQRLAREQGPQIPAMQVYHLNLQQRRQEVEDGSIHIIDMRGKDAITVELYPDQKKAVVTNIIGLGPIKDPDIIDMVKRF